MNTLALDTPEVNPAPAETEPADDWGWSDEYADALAEDAALDDAWGRACDLGHLAC